MAITMNITLNIKLVCRMVKFKELATHNSKMFNGKLIAVPIAVSIIDSTHALD